MSQFRIVRRLSTAETAPLRREECVSSIISRSCLNFTIHLFEQSNNRHGEMTPSNSIRGITANRISKRLNSALYFPPSSLHDGLEQRLAGVDVELDEDLRGHVVGEVIGPLATGRPLDGSTPPDNLAFVLPR